ncbi:hypothetical protein ACFL3I_13225 [Pseudomonadota bacterium]
MDKPENVITRREALVAGVAVSIGASKSAYAAEKPDTETQEAPVSTVQEVPETNRMTLGLYLTPQEAYKMWEANPEDIHIIEVRSFEEYIFVGHAIMARNIPLVFPRFEIATRTQ